MSNALLARLGRLEAALLSLKIAPVILFVMQSNDAGWQEQKEEIETLKKSGCCLILLSDGDGAEAWDGEYQVFPVKGIDGRDSNARPKE